MGDQDEDRAQASDADGYRDEREQPKERRRRLSNPHADSCTVDQKRGELRVGLSGPARSATGPARRPHYDMNTGQLEESIVDRRTLKNVFSRDDSP